MAGNASLAKQAQIRLFSYIQRIAPLLGRDRAWRILEDLVSEKRIRWLESQQIRPGNPVEEAYRLFYLVYLGLDPGDVEVVEKTPRRLVVRWSNPCPTLEACRTLGLDTRYVCKNVYEGSTQAFMRRIHRNLRFSRNYDAIRPHSDYCEETIELA